MACCPLPRLREGRSVQIALDGFRKGDGFRNALDGVMRQNVVTDVETDLNQTWPIERQQQELFHRREGSFRQQRHHQHQQWSRRLEAVAGRYHGRAQRDSQMRATVAFSSATSNALGKKQQRRAKSQIITHSSRHSGLDSSCTQPRFARQSRRLSPVDQQHERAKAVIQISQNARDPGGVKHPPAEYYILGQMSRTTLFDRGLTIDAVHQAELQIAKARRLQQREEQLRELAMQQEQRKRARQAKEEKASAAKEAASTHKDVVLEAAATAEAPVAREEATAGAQTTEEEEMLCRSPSGWFSGSWAATAKKADEDEAAGKKADEERKASAKKRQKEEAAAAMRKVEEEKAAAAAKSAEERAAAKRAAKQRQKEEAAVAIRKVEEEEAAAAKRAEEAAAAKKAEEGKAAAAKQAAEDMEAAAKKAHEEAAATTKRIKDAGAAYKKKAAAKKAEEAAAATVAADAAAAAKKAEEEKAAAAKTAAEEMEAANMVAVAKMAAVAKQIQEEAAAAAKVAEEMEAAKMAAEAAAAKKAEEEKAAAKQINENAAAAAKAAEEAAAAKMIAEAAAKKAEEEKAAAAAATKVEKETAAAAKAEEEQAAVKKAAEDKEAAKNAQEEEIAELERQLTQAAAQAAAEEAEAAAKWDEKVAAAATKLEEEAAAAAASRKAEEEHAAERKAAQEKEAAAKKAGEDEAAARKGAEKEQAAAAAAAARRQQRQAKREEEEAAVKKKAAEEEAANDAWAMVEEHDQADQYTPPLAMGFSHNEPEPSAPIINAMQPAALEPVDQFKNKLQRMTSTDAFESRSQRFAQISQHIQNSVESMDDFESSLQRMNSTDAFEGRLERVSQHLQLASEEEELKKLIAEKVAKDTEEEDERQKQLLADREADRIAGAKHESERRRRDSLDRLQAGNCDITIKNIVGHEVCRLTLPRAATMMELRQAVHNAMPEGQRVSPAEQRLVMQGRPTPFPTDEKGLAAPLWKAGMETEAHILLDQGLLRQTGGSVQRVPEGDCDITIKNIVGQEMCRLTLPCSATMMELRQAVHDAMPMERRWLPAEQRLIVQGQSEPLPTDETVSLWKAGLEPGSDVHTVLLSKVRSLKAVAKIVSSVNAMT